jgi:carbon storage regulator
MLVVSRKADERILIDDHIVITVVEVNGDRVKLGIAAPANVHILRDNAHNTTPKGKESSGGDSCL